MISNRRHRIRLVPPMAVGCPAARTPRQPRRRALSLGATGNRLELVRPHVLDEAVFRDVLTRERKRADRSDRPCVLLLLNLRRTGAVTGHPGAAGPGQALPENAVIDAIAAVKRKTDVAGRFGAGAIGVLVPGVCASKAGRVRERFADRVRHELARRSNLETAGRLSIQVHVSPDPTRTDGGQPATADPIARPPRPSRRAAARAIKRALDIAGSAALLILLSPLFLLIALLVKLKSRGPVIYEQARIGQDLKPFTMLKFRTMHLDADHALHREFVSAFINSRRPAAEPGAIPFFKLAGDPRVTPIGRLLRKTSLDELPQLWNVLRGDMSLVGPRPALPYELAQYKPWHRRRVLEAKPGLTGLWQVTGRSRTTFDEMVRLDLRYARTRSLWTDVRILLATPAAVISGRGAC